MEKKPFNLERALAGDPVVNGLKNIVSGIEVVESKRHKDGLILAKVQTHPGIFAEICYNLEGKILSGFNDESKNLYMVAPVKREAWVNFYNSKSPPYFTISGAFPSEKSAKNNIVFPKIYIKTKKIEVEI